MGILYLSSSRQYIIHSLYSVASLFLSVFSLNFYGIGSFCIYREGVLTFLYHNPLEGASIFNTVTFSNKFIYLFGINIRVS
jgi:hypothetical protein